jgi:hypothetical protein
MGLARVFEGIAGNFNLLDPSGWPVVALDDICQDVKWRRVRITIEVLDEPPTPPPGTGDER